MPESKSRSLVTVKQNVELAAFDALQRLVVNAGKPAKNAWEEFFAGRLCNSHTRKAYLHAVRRFLGWCESEALDLIDITPGMVGRYFDKLRGSTPTKKLHMAAIRGLFDALVLRDVIILNPALSVKTERYSAVEGRTPAIAVEQARKLLASIELKTPIDFRDRAVVGLLIYTAARAGAIARLRLRDFVDEGNQFAIHFAEKGGKARSIPVRHNLESYLEQYISAAGLSSAHKDSPLFRTAAGTTGRLSELPITGIDICRMVKRRLKSSGLPATLSPHSFRSCTTTDLLMQGVPLDDVQHLLGHADARTTRLYDRRQKQVTRNIVERISV